MATKKILIYQAKVTGWLGGTFVRVGDSVAAGHPVLKSHAASFAPFQPTLGTVTWDDEAAPKPAAPKASPKPKAAKGGAS